MLFQKNLSADGEFSSQSIITEAEELTEISENITKAYANSAIAIKAELEVINRAINSWERLAPQLYDLKKRYQFIEEFLNGKRSIEHLSSLTTGPEENPPHKRRGPAKGSRTFIRKKSEVLTDEVIEKIRDYISVDESYHKAKEIYSYLVTNGIIRGFPGPYPERSFALALARVDQDVLRYNNHYSVLAWGLSDFGTPEHARRKALKQSARFEKGSRVSTFGKAEEDVEA